MTLLIILLMELCNLLSWLALAFMDLTPGFTTAEEFEMVLVTVTADNATNMVKVFDSLVMIMKGV